jgi:hypothetical protein
MNSKGTDNLSAMNLPIGSPTAGQCTYPESRAAQLACRRNFSADRWLYHCSNIALQFAGLKAPVAIWGKAGTSKSQDDRV